MIKARGLENVGATCYMNATLQCFYHVKPLSENLINDDKIDKKLEITHCYKKLIEELTGCTNRRKFKINLEQLTDDKIDHVRPMAFKDLISKKNPLFKGIKANDSKDLVLFLLENMDSELTKRNNKTKEPEIFYGNNIEDLEEENFKKSHNSIFSELFYGFQRSAMICQNCDNEEISFNVFNYVLFPLEKTYNSLNQNNVYSKNYYNFGANMGNYYNFNQNRGTTMVGMTRNFGLGGNVKKLNLDNCFKCFESEELLTGENQIFCNKCRKMSDAKTINKIYKAPKVLIIILNRGKDNQFECDVDFPLQLDISNYIENLKESPKIYDLIGVISHLGESSMSGHFIAICKHFDDTWHLFNDAFVSNSSEADLKKGTSYILFYQCKDI
jgi:ubiquitin C-terminal hydrolase